MTVLSRLSCTKKKHDIPTNMVVAKLTFARYTPFVGPRIFTLVDRARGLSLVTFSVFTHPVNTEKKLCEHILTAARVIQEYLTTATIVEVPK